MNTEQELSRSALKRMGREPKKGARGRVQHDEGRGGIPQHSYVVYKVSDTVETKKKRDIPF